MEDTCARRNIFVDNFLYIVGVVFGFSVKADLYDIVFPGRGGNEYRSALLIIPFAAKHNAACCNPDRACYMIYAFSEQDASPESIFIRLQFCYFVYYGLYKRGIVLFVGRRTDRGGYLYMGNGHSTALITAEREIGE